MPPAFLIHTKNEAHGHNSAIKPSDSIGTRQGPQPYPLINGESGLPLPPANAGRRSLIKGRELSGRAAGSVEKAEAEAVKDPTAATRWSERPNTARLEVRTLSAAPSSLSIVLLATPRLDSVC